jgi:serine/threonine protein phosphatase PrpC
MSNQNTNERLQISLGNKSDMGKVRKKNEDYMEIFKCDSGDVFIVCDGMGGHIGGEVASRLAVFTIKEFMTENPKGITNESQLISEALNAANNALHNKTKENPDLKGMGTTCVILILKNEFAYIGNVGDSRIYLIRGNSIYQITKDQSFVQELVNQGIISYEEAENHPRKNEILQALGVNQKIDPQLNPEGLKVYKNDKFILCSDGLSGMVTDRDILNIVEQSSAMEACEKLVTLANINGGTDNITVQVIHILNGEVLPEDLKNVPPPNSTIKDSGNTAEPKSDATREMKTVKENDYRDIPEKKSNLKYYVIGCVVLLLVLLFAIWFFFLRGADKQSEIKSQEKIQVDENKAEYKTVTDKLYGFLKEKLYRGKNIENNLTPPADIIFNKFIYKGDRDAQTKQIGFSDLKDDIKMRDIWLIDLKDLSLKGNNYIYKMYLKIGNNEIKVPYELVVDKLDGNKLEIKEIVYFTPPPETSKEENRDVQKQKPANQPQENKGGEQKKEDNNPIDKTIKKAENEGEKIKDKVEEKIPDLKKEK